MCWGRGGVVGGAGGQGCPPRPPPKGHLDWGLWTGGQPGQLNPAPPPHPCSPEPSPYDESEVHDSFYQLIQEQSQWVAEEGLELQQREPGPPETPGEPPRRAPRPGPVCGSGPLGLWHWDGDAAGGVLSLATPPGLAGCRSQWAARLGWGWGGMGWRTWLASRVSGTSGCVFPPPRQWPPDPAGARGPPRPQHGHTPHLGQHAQPHYR